MNPALSALAGQSMASLVASRSITLRKPAAGQSDTYRVAPGETLDLAPIANENITLVKLGARLVVLFPDKAFVVVDGLYLPDGQANPDVLVDLDSATHVTGTQFVSQFPISTDEQILTAAGISPGARGSGGINLAAAAPGSAFSSLSDLTPGLDPLQTSPLSQLLPSSFNGNNRVPVSGPVGQPLTVLTSVAVADAGAVREAGVAAGNKPDTGVSLATGNVLTNDTFNQSATITGVAVGTVSSASGNVGTALQGTFGSLNLKSDGTFTYTLDNADADTQSLASGQVATETFSYTLTDIYGLSSTTSLTITVTGTNDAPVVTGGTIAGTVVEAGVSGAGEPAATGTLSAADVDHGATLTFSGNATGTYGAFVINPATGSWTYTLDNALANSLAQGETKTETFTATVTDEFGATATQVVTITVTGTNDAPVVTGGTIAGTVVEAGVSGAGEPAATGTLSAADVDHGATLTFSGNATGTYGAFVINPATGSWTYTLDNALANSLAQGETKTETFTATVTDEFGATATQVVIITVTGTNDAPAIDIDTTAAGVDYAGVSVLEAARSTNLIDSTHGVAIVQTNDTLESPVAFVSVSDVDGDKIASVHIAIEAAASGDQGALVISPFSVSTPFSSTGNLGPTVDIASSTTGFTYSDIANILSNVRFVNTDQTFALDTADRIIDVTITDIHGASTTVQAHVPVIADVRDTTGLDSFTGTRFDDRIEGMGGSDTIHAGDGNDTIVYRAGDGADIMLDGGIGTDTLQILGTDGDDTFHVNTVGGLITQLSSGSDALPVLANLNSIENITLDGLDFVNDTLSYAGNADVVSVDLAAGTATGFTSITHIENVTGGTQNDTILGDIEDNILRGGDGDDIIDGRQGDNWLFGDAGDDTLSAGNGSDTIDTGTGDNTVNAGDGDNVITAYDGSDTITSGSGDDKINAGGGDDIINAGNGDNTVLAGAGDDTITTGSGDDRIEGGTGDDRITTGSGNDTLVLNGNLSSLGTDILTDFTTGADTIDINHLFVGNGLATLGADTGTLDASRFTTGAGFTNTTQRFLFNTTDNTLYYDADGSGGAEGAIALAQLENGGTVAATDIRLS